MPTGILTAAPNHFNLATLLVPVLPGLIAPHFNIDGAELHEGGVTENEIIIRVQKGSKYDRNVPDLNLFMRAHQFEGRAEQCQNNTQAIHNAIRAELDAADHKDVSLSVEIIICELGYASSKPGKGELTVPIVDISGLSKDEAVAKKCIRKHMQRYFSQWLNLPESATTVTYIDDETAEEGKKAHVMVRVYSQRFMKMAENDLKAMCEDFVEILEEEAGHHFHEVFPIPIMMIYGRHKPRDD